MQYSTSIIINLPRTRVIELFDNVDNLAQWQDGLQSFEHLSGQPGQAGAQSKLTFDTGDDIMEMIETITRRDLPDAIDMTYETEGVFNINHNRFIDEGDQTRWEARHEFQFSGAMAELPPGMDEAFQQQTLQTMNAFKAFAERAG